MNSAAALSPSSHAAPAPVWLVAGQIVIDRDPRPSMIVDAAGRIRATNRPLAEQQVRGELVGRRWVEAWSFDGSGARAAAEAMSRAREGKVAHVTLGAATPQGETSISLFELSTLGPGADAALVVSMLATKVSGRVEAARPASGLHYELDADTPWHLRHVWSADAQPLRAHGPCYETLHGRSSPCEGCPVSKIAETGEPEARSVMPTREPRLRLEVVNARRAPAGTISVSAWTVDEGLLSTLLSAKVDALAREARLSERERSVLDLLLLGRSHAEIGIVLGITARTAKYHQARVQAKLGVDSRVDLLRILL